VAEHVVVVECFLDESSFAHEQIDRGARSVRADKQGRAVDLSDHTAVGLDPRVGPDDLEVEDDPVRGERFVEPA
jgi:hypothetical protein